jgi:LPXTG-site transpeptidase (sortase) family protein
MGQRDNMVIFGHSSWQGQPGAFRRLDELRPGQAVAVYGARAGSWYVITSVVIVREKGATLAERIANGELLGHSSDRRLTLVTCWPYLDDTYRLVVIAKPGLVAAP